MQKWSHPGGKLRELGPKSLTDSELLSILISSGIKGKPAEKIVAEIESERKLVDANKKLIKIFGKKIKDKIGEVWGE